MQTVTIPSKSEQALKKLTKKQIKIFRDLLIARKENNINKVVEIVMNASPEDTEAINEVLKYTGEER